MNYKYNPKGEINMSELKIFENEEFGKVRVVEIENEPWFVGKDVAEILGYADSFGALKKHVDSEDKQNCQNNSFESNRGMAVINESGLYSLVLSSKLPTAKQFKRWVTSEVIPSIRKNGGYIAGQETLSDDELIARALIVAQNKIEERDKIIAAQQEQIEADKPKAIFADAVSASKTSILVGELSKILKQNGIDIGQNRLFEWMRNNGYLIKSGSSRNLPTQKSMDRKLFEIKERTVNSPDGCIKITKTPLVTGKGHGKGQVYFVNAFLNELKGCATK